MRHRGEMKMVGGGMALGILRDFLALLLCLGFVGFLLLYLPGGL